MSHVSTSKVFFLFLLNDACAKYFIFRKFDDDYDSNVEIYAEKRNVLESDQTRLIILFTIHSEMCAEILYLFFNDLCAKTYTRVVVIW